MNFLKKIKSYLLSLLFRFYHYVLIPLRYKVNILGSGRISSKLTNPRGGVLFLSNHPSHLDATFLSLALLKFGYQISIWTLGYVYKNPYTKLVTRNYETVKLMKVPNVYESRLQKNHSRLFKLITKTVEKLKKGENVLFFPSGMQKHSALEEIDGKSAVQKILNLYPDVNIVFVRLTGMWGSRFSKAVKKSDRSDAKGDNWIKFIWNLINIITFNLIFFIPKRKISLEFDPAGEDFPRTGSRLEINQYMERYFNRGFDKEGEPLVRVPNYFWKTDYVPVEYHLKSYQFDLSEVPSTLINDVIHLIANKAQIDPTKIKIEMQLDKDLSLDSLELTEILIELEKKYYLPQYLPKQVSSVGHLIALTAQVPVEYRPILGKFYKVYQEVPAPLRIWQACAVFVASFFSFLYTSR
jgi:long-chain-fatty-acid--[acyl-carrier-protein] ligase